VRILLVALCSGLIGCAAGESTLTNHPHRDGPPSDRKPPLHDLSLDQAIPDAPVDDLPQPQPDVSQYDASRIDASRIDKGRPDKARADSLRPDHAKPDSKPPTPDTGPKILFSYDFEASCNSLVATKDWQCGAYSKATFKNGTNCSSGIAPPPACHSGTHCWGTVLLDCYNPLDNAANACSNTDTTDDSILRLQFLIPSTYKSAKLEFWEWTDYFLPFDWAEVRANSTVLYQDCVRDYSAPTAWVKRTLSLNSYIGKQVTLEFHFMATSIVNYSGWYLDDISVSE
jgi:hypothetical protein